MARHHPPLRWLLVICALIALSGCGGGEESPSPKAKAATTTSTISAAQVASIVARHRPDIVAAVEADQNCFDRASALDCFTAANRIQRLAKIAVEADELHNELEPVTAVGADVRELRLGTLEKLAILQTKAQAMKACVEANTVVQPCEPALDEMQRVAAGLVTELRGWDPYI